MQLVQGWSWGLLLGARRWGCIGPSLAGAPGADQSWQQRYSCRLPLSRASAGLIFRAKV